MTFELLSRLIEKHDIPKDVELISNSGWECNATDMNGVYYNRKDNLIVFTQDGEENDDEFYDPEWELIYGNNLKCKTCSHLGTYGYCDALRKRSNDGHIIHFAVCVHNTNDCELYEKGE